MQGRQLGAYALAGLGIVGLGALLYANLGDASTSQVRSGSARPAPQALTERVAPATTTLPTHDPATDLSTGSAAVGATPTPEVEPDELERFADPSQSTAVKGFVRTAEGAPAVDAKVTLSGATPRSTHTDSRGAFFLPLPPADEAPSAMTGEVLFRELSATSADGTCRSPSDHGLEVVPGEVAEVNLVLTPHCGLILILDREPGEVDIKVHFVPDAGPLPEDPDSELELSYYPEEGEEPLTRFDLADETFVSPGAYSVSLLGVDDSGELCWAAGSTRLAAGEHKELRLSLQALSPVTIQLRKGGVPVAGEVLVTLLDAQDPDWPQSNWERAEPEQGFEVVEGEGDVSGGFRLEGSRHEGGGISNSSVLVFEEDLGSSATDSEGTLTLNLPPGRWRVRGLPKGTTHGRAEAIVDVAPGRASRCTLDFVEPQSATVLCPTGFDSHTEFAVYGPPGLRVDGRGEHELIVDGLLPGDGALVYMFGARAGEEVIGTAVVAPGTQGPLAVHAPSSLEVVLEFEFNSHYDLSWTVQIELLDAQPQLDRGPYVVYTSPAELWGEDADVGPDRTTYRADTDDDDDALELGSRICRALAGGGSFRLLPGRYRVSIDGWPGTSSQLVTLEPRGEHTVEFRMGR